MQPFAFPDHCLVPKKVGPCRASYPRWHYNAVSEKCEEFNFGGCKENRNNYLSQAECETACDGISGTQKRQHKIVQMSPCSFAYSVSIF